MIICARRLPKPRRGSCSNWHARRTGFRDFPRIGEKLDAYAPREVRRIIVGSYEMRYEIAGATINILRLWHCRENRSFEPDT
jgi:plasmid stabilization system protein ParE